jgi:hypothetical protein
MAQRNSPARKQMLMERRARQKQTQPLYKHRTAHKWRRPPQLIGLARFIKFVFPDGSTRWMHPTRGWRYNVES